ncbi:hypothetical protein [Aquirhabdus sp.]|uniref:hypothetical protein n=1 Tax=Aquirhabdus sp. TaxID=2824160 RepID=UPI00396C9307
MTSSKLSPKAEALLNAHVEHTIAQLQNFDVIRAEVAALFEQLLETPLSTLVPLDIIQRIAKERVLDIAPSNQLRTEIANIVKDALKNPEGKNTLISDLVPDATAEVVINLIANETDKRNQLIHQIFSNPATGEILSTTISHAIKDYMENNVVTKKIPGASSLMKLGKGVLERATDSNLDDALQNYLSRNIRNIMSISEKKTKEQLGSKQVHRIAAEVWSTIKTKPASIAGKFVDDQTVDAASHLIVVIWNHIRTGKYVQSIVAEGTAGWYARNSNRSIVELLSDVNVTPDFIVAELEPSLKTTIKHLADNGYLKTRIEPLLRLFYASTEAHAILKD